MSNPGKGFIPPRKPSDPKPANKEPAEPRFNHPIHPSTPSKTNADGQSASPGKLSGHKRPSDGDHNQENQPPSQRLRTDSSTGDLEDGRKQVSADRYSSSQPFGVSSANMELMIEGLKSAVMNRIAGAITEHEPSSRFRFMGDPLLMWLLSMQTGMMACTADLLFRRGADQGNNYRRLIEEPRKSEEQLKIKEQSGTDAFELDRGYAREDDNHQPRDELEALKSKISELDVQLSEVKQEIVYLEKKLQEPNHAEHIMKKTPAYQAS